MGTFHSSMRGAFKDEKYFDFAWGIEFIFPFREDSFLPATRQEYMEDLVRGGLCTQQFNPSWDSVMAEVQIWGSLIRQVMQNYNRSEDEARIIVAERSIVAWENLVAELTATRQRVSAAPLRPENQRELIEQLENVRSQFFYTTPEQVDKEVGRLNSTRLGLLHSIYNVAGVVMSPQEVTLLTSAASTLSTKISGLMQTRKRLAEQAKDKQSGPLDTSF